MVFILGSMEIGMKESGRNACDMVMEQISLQMVICMLDSTRKEDLMDLDSTSGLTAIHIQETFTLGKNMERENGRKLHQIFQTKIISINSRDTMKWIKNMDSVSSFGSLATNMREITMQMKDKATER